MDDAGVVHHGRIDQSGSGMLMSWPWFCLAWEKLGEKDILCGKLQSIRVNWAVIKTLVDMISYYLPQEVILPGLLGILWPRTGTPINQYKGWPMSSATGWGSSKVVFACEGPQRHWTWQQCISGPRSAGLEGHQEFLMGKEYNQPIDVYNTIVSQWVYSSLASNQPCTVCIASPTQWRMTLVRDTNRIPRELPNPNPRSRA